MYAENNGVEIMLPTLFHNLETHAIMWGHKLVEGEILIMWIFLGGQEVENTCTVAVRSKFLDTSVWKPCLVPTSSLS